MLTVCGHLLVVFLSFGRNHFSPLYHTDQLDVTILTTATNLTAICTENICIQDYNYREQLLFNIHKWTIN